MKDVTDYDCPLPDVRAARIDPKRPEQENIRLFIPGMYTPDDVSPALLNFLTGPIRRLN